MDIVKKINLKPIAATHESLGVVYKIAAVAMLVSMSSLVFPYGASASEQSERRLPQMVFESGDHTQFLAEAEDAASFRHRHETAVTKLKQQLYLNDALKQYLQSKRSPLAEYSHVLIQQNNWKKILALSNAESTMCRRYIEEKANCWGVGGSNLWDMGENLGEGIVSMNHFLNNYPSRSPVKYYQMNFEQMNGLYKQPPGDHWVYNNLQVYNELTALERSLR